MIRSQKFLLVKNAYTGYLSKTQTFEKLEVIKFLRDLSSRVLIPRMTCFDLNWSSLGGSISD